MEISRRTFLFIGAAATLGLITGSGCGGGGGSKSSPAPNQKPSFVAQQAGSIRDNLEVLGIVYQATPMNNDLLLTQITVGGTTLVMTGQTGQSGIWFLVNGVLPEDPTSSITKTVVSQGDVISWQYPTS